MKSSSENNSSENKASNKTISSANVNSDDKADVEGEEEEESYNIGNDDEFAKPKYARP